MRYDVRARLARAVSQKLLEDLERVRTVAASPNLEPGCPNLGVLNREVRHTTGRHRVSRACCSLCAIRPREAARNPVYYRPASRAAARTGQPGNSLEDSIEVARPDKDHMSTRRWRLRH